MDSPLNTSLQPEQLDLQPILLGISKILLLFYFYPPNYIEYEYSFHL